MPSKRKRIGFLPREEVQKIIDQICKHNKLSQSKVTGILVEEALSFRGLLNISLDKKSLRVTDIVDKSLLNINEYSNNESLREKDNLNLDENYVKDEVKMINDFIEFKFFKNIVNQKKFLRQ